MASSFPYHHGAMLLKYSGISFIAGAVNHGFFSGERSLWTAAAGIVLFVLGAVMEHRISENKPGQAHAGLMRALLLGTLLSIGLGFFTGGLQHFPDSPERSAWVVPLGFLISLLALAMSGAYPWKRATSMYLLVLGTLVTGGSYGALHWLLEHPHGAFEGHVHGSAGVTAPGLEDQAAPADIEGLVVSRSIEVRMDDQMRFSPSEITVRAGETIRFVVHNAGQTAHEMVLGSEAALREHAEAMRRESAHSHSHHHGTGAAILLDGGKTGELVVRFAQSTTLQMACLIPGHYQAGMRGTVRVSEAGAGEPRAHGAARGPVQGDTYNPGPA